MFEILQPWSGK